MLSEEGDRTGEVGRRKTEVGSRKTASGANREAGWPRPGRSAIPGQPWGCGGVPPHVHHCPPRRRVTQTMAAITAASNNSPMTMETGVHGSAVMICDCATTWHNTGRSGGRRSRSPDRKETMARHVCPNCGATVTGDEQFCPTCGTFMGYDDEPTGEDEYERFELGAAPPPREPTICPSCGAANAPGNRHCEECGARLSQGPLPAAPRPAVQATAGVRAVIAIGGPLLGAANIALL